ncbi:MAG: hypothetical protein ACRD0A_14705 [Acidimicrobiales bacterium]
MDDLDGLDDLDELDDLEDDAFGGEPDEAGSFLRGPKLFVDDDDLDLDHADADDVDIDDDGAIGLGS